MPSLREEAGFRGYIQGGLERRFGAVTAIAATSLLFWLVHFNHPDGSARWALLIGMSVLLGALTYCAGSIRPAIVCHAGLDTIYFVLGASDTAPWFFRQPPQFADTGLDTAFVVFSILLLLSGIAAVFVLRKIGAARSTIECDAARTNSANSPGVPSLQMQTGKPRES